jgi:hypothetical protein
MLNQFLPYSLFLKPLRIFSPEILIHQSAIADLGQCGALTQPFCHMT